MSNNEHEPEVKVEASAEDSSLEDTEPSPTGDVEVGTLQSGDDFQMEGKVYQVGRVTDESVECLEMTEAKVGATRSKNNVISKYKVIRYAVARINLPPDTRVTRL